MGKGATGSEEEGPEQLFIHASCINRAFVAQGGFMTLGVLMSQH